MLSTTSFYPSSLLSMNVSLYAGKYCVMHISSFFKFLLAGCNSFVINATYKKYDPRNSAWIARNKIPNFCIEYITTYNEHDAVIMFISKFKTILNPADSTEYKYVGKCSCMDHLLKK